MRDSQRTPTRRQPSPLGAQRKQIRLNPDYVSRELMTLAVEAAHCRQLPTFLAAFAKRAAELLQAEWGAVGEILGTRVELHEPEGAFTPSQAERTWLDENILRCRTGLQVLDCPKGESACAFYPLYASDHELMGTLCLTRSKARFDEAEERLLEALASHAALVMEKVRRFSQLERSKKQWVEDIDAISDYIVVHDPAWRIVRTNRSLAAHLGIPPVALVGEPISSLRQIAETGGALPCPFCRNTNQDREEYVVSADGRTFLVSTSRRPGLTDEDGRTIHVLKDITDRQEAERRYRELFDNIQEGLFFATPEARGRERALVSNARRQRTPGASH